MYLLGGAIFERVPATGFSLGIINTQLLDRRLQKTSHTVYISIFRTTFCAFLKASECRLWRWLCDFGGTRWFEAISEKAKTLHV